MDNETRELATSPFVPAVGKHAWYKLSALKSLRCRIYIDDCSNSEYNEAPRTARTTLTSMGSSSKTVKVPADAKSRILKRRRKVVLEITRSIIPAPQVGSVFDGLSELDRVLALSYYYDHPDELPERETVAMRRADLKPLKIRVTFELDIFEREVCLRPIPLEELEEVDPFTIHPQASRAIVKRMAQAFSRPIFHERRTPSLDDL